ncbi:adenylyl-sulfate kinase [Pseudomonas sp. NPDC089734]|uniref:adenylyl-sulfate kinase n=1 Tax=Pseudomonas sp. NPDC089734 TaxID=3364469 RepID=UPI003816A2B0
MKKNITPMPFKPSTLERASHHGHQSGVIWLTGLSGSGKSTLAMSLDQELIRQGYSSFVLDGDNLRNGLNSNLGFSHEDRSENIRRAAEVSALFSSAGLICIAAFISPYRADRALARKICGHNFFEVHVSTQLSACESRDPKGLYKKARAGEIPDFTGIGSPYEEPEHPDLAIDTSHEPLTVSVQRLLAFTRQKLSLENPQ